MRATTLVASLALIASTLAVPADHQHGARRHHHRRELQERAYVVVDVTITVGPDGQPLATEAVTMTEEDTVVVAGTSTTPVSAVATDAGEKLAVVPVAVSSTPAAVIPVTTTSTPVQTTSEQPVQAVSTPKTTTSAAPASTPVVSNSGSSSGLAIQAGSVANPMAKGVASTLDFVDGTIPCSQFPSSVPGILDLSYLGFGGYTGIQINGGAGSTCVEGALCSYSCQPGAMKSQWPSSQPSDGESRGGFQCTNGFLHMSDSSKKQPCIWGELTAYVKSSLSQGVAICQTDYPGSENMVIPTWVAPGESAAPLAVPDEATYYQWQGKPTSAQFYVNNAGVSQEAGCLWGTSGSNVGNYAPLNFGAGYTSGTTWLSMIPNPNTATTLNFNVRMVAGPGTNMNGACSYINGVYSGASATSSGCTVACDGPCWFELY